MILYDFIQTHKSKHHPVLKFRNIKDNNSPQTEYVIWSMFKYGKPEQFLVLLKIK